MIKNLFTYGLGESLAKGLNWLILATMPLFVSSTAEYGIIGLIVAVEGLGATALLIGLDRAILRFYFHDEEPKTFLFTVLVLCLLAVLPLFITTVGLAFSIQSIGGIPLFPHAVFLISAIFFLNLQKIYLAVLRIEEASRLYVGLRVLFVLLKGIIIVGVVLHTQESISYVLGILLASIVVFVVIVPGLKSRINLRFDSEAAKELWFFGWPFIFHVVSGNILMFADRFMLEHYVDLSAVGTYTFAYTLGSAVVFIYGALALYFEPLIYKKAEDIPATEKMMGSYSVFCIMMGAIWGILIVFSLPYLIDNLFGETYSSILIVTPIVLAAHLIMPVYHQANYRLTLYKKTKVLAKGTFIAAALNVMLNAILIPDMGERGAALATFASLLALSIIVYISSIRSTSIQWKNIKSLHIYILTILGMLVLVLSSSDTTSYIIFILLIVLTGSFLLSTSTQFRMLVLRS